MKSESNISTKNITEFTTEDTIYIPEKGQDQGNIFLCQFVSYDAKKQIVTGKVIDATINPSLYKHRIEDGLMASNSLTKCSLYGENPSTPGRGFNHYFNSLGYALDPLEEHKIIENEMHVSKHPSFGMISASRITGSSRSLFGSSIQHGNTIRVKIATAEHTRDNNYDHIYAEKQLIEVEMSQLQFAEFITSMNVGDGVPCTLKHIEYNTIPEPPTITKGEIFKNEFSAQMHNLGIDMKKMVKDAIDILNNKPTLNKADREIILNSIQKIGRELSDSIPYMSSQFEKQMGKVVLEAKGEFEAFIENKIRSTGIKALNDPEVIKQLKENTNL